MARSGVQVPPGIAPAAVKMADTLLMRDVDIEVTHENEAAVSADVLTSATVLP